MTHVFRNHSCRMTFAAILLFGATTAGAQSTLPQPGYVDEAEFREGLRQRNLTDWFEQYLQDTPPIDEVDKQLRRREQLLDEATHPQKSITPSQREALVKQASQILSSLIADHPEHPSRLRWRFELARDLLERRRPEVFDALLLYELPGRDRALANKLSSQAMASLQQLRQELADTWKSLEGIEESALEQLTTAGSLSHLESLDARSLHLLAWAKFYRALSTDEPEPKRREALSAVLAEVTERYAWTKLPAGFEAQQCRALLIAAIAARNLEKLTEANQYARQIITTLKKVTDPTELKGLKKVSLLAVLEQIRVMRDSSRADEALKAISQAKGWQKRTRPDDIQAAVALALAERSLLAKQSGKTASLNQPWSLLQPVEALWPLEQFAEQSTAHREALFTTIAQAVEHEPFSAARTPFQLQLLAGATVMDVLDGLPNIPPALRQRLEEAVQATQNTMSSLASGASPTIYGELSFLLGRMNYLLGRRLEAVNALTQLVEQLPEHDRTPVAVKQASAIALELLRQPNSQKSPQARQAFIRAGKLLRKQLPQSLNAKQLQYFIALALEQNSQLEEASAEYAAVPADDTYALEAAFGRARCLKSALDQALADHTPNQATIRELTQRALQAGRDATRAAQTHSPGQAQKLCLKADIVRLMANLLNHPAINKHKDALATLEGFESRFADCQASIGPALRERILAHQQLKQLSKAREVVNQFLVTDPENAGPVMAKLLEAMRDEINTAADRGDMKVSKQIAMEAARLTQTLIEWSKQRPEHVAPAELLSIQVWQAWSLLNASQPAEALKVYETCEQVNSSFTDTTFSLEIRLGKAECLLALNQAREALPLFAEAWSRSPEQSLSWWRAFVGSLQCHTQLESDPQQILQSIKQQRYLSPDLGGPRWKRVLEVLENTNLERTKDSTVTQ